MSINLLIYVIYQRVGRATEKAKQEAFTDGYNVAPAMCTNGTAVEVVYVTSAANRPVICPVRPGNCPGSKLVWRVYLHQSR